MAATHILLTTFLMTTTGSGALQIINIDVPKVIQNNSRDSVVLDCEYRYEEYEVPGLEVKWFWNDGPEPVYQWIPGKRPEALGILKGRVNTWHRASKDRNSIHRAVEILKPTPDLTGTFMCRVSSFHDEDSASRNMIVYSPARSMNMTFVKKKRRAVRFFCGAVGAFPQPVLKIVVVDDDKIKRMRVEKEKELELEGKWSEDDCRISLEAEVRDKTLPKEALVRCVLHIPGTSYRLRRQVLYFPDYTYSGFDGRSSWMKPSEVVTLLAPLLLKLLL